MRRKISKATFTNLMWTYRESTHIFTLIIDRINSQNLMVFIYFTGWQTYLTVVLNLDFYDTSPYTRCRSDLNFLTAPEL